MDMYIAGFVAAVVGAGFYSWSKYNALMALDERCETAFADIDVQLKHRHSLLPNLVETVRGYVKHEHSVLVAVTDARASALRATGTDSRVEAEMQLGQSINSLISVTEKYPDLQASSHFRELRKELADAENKITAARRFFNLAVNEFNTVRRQLPAVFIANSVNLASRKAFDLGMERVLLDEPAVYRF